MFNDLLKRAWNMSLKTGSIDSRMENGAEVCCAKVVMLGRGFDNKSNWFSFHRLKPSITRIGPMPLQTAASPPPVQIKRAVCSYSAAMFAAGLH
jgi:hypothetical protein